MRKKEERRRLRKKNWESDTVLEEVVRGDVKERYSIVIICV